jgi:hypothetical protein
MPEFSGSYPAGDVEFLLKPLAMEPIADVLVKERLIQSGRRHYSEIIGTESHPGPEYMAIFEQAVEANLDRMAADVWALARRILLARPRGVVLVSLARAGTPVGVALRRLLRDGFGVEAPHYSVSIIRDRGIDHEALTFIARRHDPAEVAFIDGWTGKGAIAMELRAAMAALGTNRPVGLRDELYVLADLAGVATACGSTDDYLIPSAILNATVSGLVSRTILNELVGPGDFHGCLYYEHLSAEDRSRWFIDRLHKRVMELLPRFEVSPLPACDMASARRRSERVVADLMSRFAVHDRNHVKPGIGEATRALLRRSSRLLILRDPMSAEVRHLRALAASRGVSIMHDSDFPLAAAAIITRLSDG